MTQAQSHERLHQQAAADVYERLQKAEHQRDKLAEALRTCEAQMTRIECGHDKGPCFGQAIDAARAALADLDK